eukprot:6046270-Prymnesium_polylepis.1
MFCASPSGPDVPLSRALAAASAAVGVPLHFLQERRHSRRIGTGAILQRPASAQPAHLWCKSSQPSGAAAGKRRKPLLA